MSRSKSKDKYRPTICESIGLEYIGRDGKRKKETYLTISESMLITDAFMDLNPRQQMLYVFCKLQLFGKRKPARDFREMPEMQDDGLFYFSWKQARYYRLYPETSHSNFYKDMRALESHGFIEEVADGSINRTKTVYRLSSKWQNWTAGDDYAPAKKPARNAEGKNGH